MPESVVKGYKKPNTAGSEYNALQFVIQQAVLSQVHTAIPVKVTAVDGMYVDVLPLVTQVDAYNKAVEPTTLYHLPAMRYWAGVAAVIVTPVPGDIGLAVFAQTDSSTVKQGTEAPQQPGSFRRFSMADGFYIGGFHPAEPSVWIEITQDNKVNITAPDSVNITSPQVNMSGNCDIKGDCVIGGISFLGRTHTGVHGETSPPH